MERAGSIFSPGSCFSGSRRSLSGIRGLLKITTRSHGAVINFEEGAELRSANNVLIQTMIAYDSGAGNIFHDSTDQRELFDVEVNIDTPVEGDILHQDYQRNMIINVNSDYAGRVVTGSITAWNNLWSKESLAAALEATGMTESFDLNDEAVANIRSQLVREEDTAAYTDVFGITMNIGQGAVWTVDGESSVSVLNIEDGAVVADEIYADCEYGQDGYLDKTTGSKIENIEAGEYHNVVLVGGTAAAGE